MSLSVGIVGFPNVGKSTLFNLLLKRQVADVANYPFTTIKPHTGVVEVENRKLNELTELIKLNEKKRDKIKVVPAAVTFVDIAGLVKNAHKGEGLGNEFLGQIRNVDALVHVLRGFESGDVAHVMGSVDPERDREIINIELELAEIKKPVIYVINCKEDQVKASWLGAEAFLSFDLSDEKVDLSPLIKRAYSVLDLITFYTIKGGKEIRAWALPKGRSVIEAAERVHTDFSQGFIRAEVIGVDELLGVGGWRLAKDKGRMRTEGKDYVVEDGDVVEFLISNQFPRSNYQS